MDSAQAAEGGPGEALYKLPGYQTQVQERTVAARQMAANVGLSQSGRMVEEAAKISGDVLDTAYGRYMNYLSGMSQPQATTKIENLRMGYSAQGQEQQMNEQIMDLYGQRQDTLKQQSWMDFGLGLFETASKSGWFGKGKIE